MLCSSAGEEALEMWPWPSTGKGEVCRRAQGLHWIPRAFAGRRGPSNPMDGCPMRKEARRGKARGAQGGLLLESIAPTSCAIGKAKYGRSAKASSGVDVLREELWLPCSPG